MGESEIPIGGDLALFIGQPLLVVDTRPGALFSTPGARLRWGLLIAIGLLLSMGPVLQIDTETALKFGQDNLLVWSVPMVAFGVGRYMYLVQTGRGGGSPTRIFLGGDLLFLCNTLAWAAVILGVVLHA